MAGVRGRVLAGGVIVAGLVVGLRGEARTTRQPLYRTSMAMSAPLIAASADGVPHILYPSAEDRLRHAWRVDGRWRDEPVNPEFDLSGAESAVVDSAGRLHVAYSAWSWDPEGPAALLHGIRDASGWTSTPIGEAHSLAMLALGPDDRPRAFCRTPERTFVVGTFDGVAWSREPTGLQADPWNDFLDFAVDGEGVGHALYRRDSRSYYATDASGTWTEEAPPGVAQPGGLVVDAAGRPHILTVTGEPGSLRVDHVRREEDGWASTAVVETADPAGSWSVTGLRADPAGRLFASILAWEHKRGSWHSASLLGLYDGRGWRVVPLGGRRAGLLVSLARGGDGTLHGVVGGLRMQHLAAGFPDLEIAWTDDGVKVGPDGSSASGTLRIRNAGAARAPRGRISFLLSEDGEPGGEDERLGRPMALPPLRPGGEITLTVDLPLPPDAAGKRILAVLGTGRRRIDLDRTNDVAAALLGP